MPKKASYTLPENIQAPVATFLEFFNGLNAEDAKQVFRAVYTTYEAFLARSEDAHRISVEWFPYDPGDMKRPYIAKIIGWAKKAIYEWGIWLGTASTGGTLEIFARDGDIVVYGQSPWVRNRAHPPLYVVSVVMGDDLEEITYMEMIEYWERLLDARTVTSATDDPIDYGLLLREARRAAAKNPRRSKATAKKGAIE